MDRHDRQAIDSLFEKLANVERQSPPRDAEAESFIGEQIARQPHAPYYMAQTIVVQEQALNAAQVRIEELEREVASGQSSGGGLVSSIFGDSLPPRPTGSVPRAGRSEPIPSEAFQRMSQRAGGGFLAGAAQTAMGVAGGILLGNMIAGMFGSDQAQAAEPQADNTGAEDASLEDTRFDDSGFGDIDI
jgi:uncharacterized protein